MHGNFGAGDISEVCEGRGSCAAAVRAAQAAAAAAEERSACGRPHPVGAAAASPHRAPHVPVSHIIPLVSTMSVPLICIISLAQIVFITAKEDVRLLASCCMTLTSRCP